MTGERGTPRPTWLHRLWTYARRHLDVVAASAATAVTGAVLLATHTGSPGLAEATDLLGADQVLVCGEEAVDDRILVAQLAERGRERILTAGGPHLASSMVAAGVLDEVCLSLTPVVVGGTGPRMTTEVATVTRGRWLLGPSLEVYARRRPT